MSSCDAHMKESVWKRTRWTAFFWGGADENKRSTIVCVEIRMAWMWKVSGGFSLTDISAKKGETHKELLTWLAAHLNGCEVKCEPAWRWWWWSVEVINPPLVSLCLPVFLCGSLNVIFAPAHMGKQGPRVCVFIYFLISVHACVYCCGKSSQMQASQPACQLCSLHNIPHDMFRCWHDLRSLACRAAWTDEGES